jgi:hypothetical protein
MDDLEKQIIDLDENLHKWFKEKWVRFGTDGKIRGSCAREKSGEGKPKCRPLIEFKIVCKQKGWNYNTLHWKKSQGKLIKRGLHKGFRVDLIESP